MPRSLVDLEAGSQERWLSRVEGPWPGWQFTGPMAAGFLILVALALGALRLVAARPRNGADAELVRVDDALRRTTAEGVLASVGMSVAGAIAVWAGIAGAPLRPDPLCDAGVPWGELAVALTGLAAGVALLCCAIVVLVPGSGERR